MILLFDVGNTHTHAGLADGRRVLRNLNFRTGDWGGRGTERKLNSFIGLAALEAGALSSVVPGTTPRVREYLRKRGLPVYELSARTARRWAKLGIDYPRPEAIGADRLANAIAAKAHYKVPAVVVDFGTAVTFDVVNRRGKYVGGIIAPGLAAMTDYLHEKTALLPRIRIREVKKIIGKNTREAMLIGAVHGYRGLIRELLVKLKRELGGKSLAVVATGGYAALLAGKLAEITAVDPLLTLEGLRLFCRAAQAARGK